MKIGVMWRLMPDDIAKDVPLLASLGFDRCHLSFPDPGMYGRVPPSDLKSLFDTFHIRIEAVWCGLGAPGVWDLIDGPGTIGFVPEKYRSRRLEILDECGGFCGKLGVHGIITHAGFIPEDNRMDLYSETIDALGKAADIAARHACRFLLETGQETPGTLLRTMRDLDRNNAGVNVDTGNLVLYGKGDPVEAVDILGKYILGIHAKDGLYPVPGQKIGSETCIGKGSVRFADLIARLKKNGYEGDIMIEREISGRQKMIDIEAGRDFLSRLI